MDASAAVSAIQSTQNMLQALATTLTMTAYLFPPQANISDGDTFDYIVVGSGSAGSVIASRLTEDPNVRVLLVEAGGDPPIESVAGVVNDIHRLIITVNVMGNILQLPAYMAYLKNTKVDWNYTSTRDGTQEFHKNEVTDMTRGKMLGGCSSNNFMGYVRGSPEDYNTWANIAQDQSWNYSNILSYFKKSENLKDKAVLNSPSGVFHGTKGNIGVTKQRSNVTHKYLEALKEIGHKIVLDTNGKMTLGYNEPMYNIANGVRQSTAYSYLGPAKARPNLYVAKHTLVTRIIFDNSHNAVAVEVINENGKNILLKANEEIIISAGSINTPQLLMLSGIGPEQHLNHMGIKVIANLPVGENLQDHSPIILVYATEKAPSKTPTNPHNYALPMILGYVAMNKSLDCPDYQTLIIVGDSDSLVQLCAFSFSFKTEVCQKLYNESKDKEVFFISVAPLHPKSRGRILLRSTNPLDHPIISLGIYSNERDLKNAMTYIQDFNRVTESEYFQRTNSKLLVPPQCEGFQLGSQQYWQCHAQTMVTTIFHYVGTCAIGSVVDARLRVYGVNRLRIADGSVMPMITSGNTNAPIMMIGEKAADMIKEDYAKLAKC